MALKEGLLFGLESYRDDIATITGGSFESDYPALSMLDEEELAKVARTTDAATSSTTFTVELTKARFIGFVAFIFANPGVDGRRRIRIYSELAQTNLTYDSGMDWFWPQTEDDPEWEDDNWWTRTYLQSDVEGFSPPHAIFLDEAVWGQSIQIDIEDTGNPDGYFELGFFEVGNYFQPTYNCEYGSRFGFRFRTKAEEAKGGAKFFEREDKPRVWIGGIKQLAHDEVMAKFFEMQRVFDLDRPLLFASNPKDTVNSVRDVIFGRLIEPDLFSYAFAGHDAVPIAVEEML